MSIYLYPVYTLTLLIAFQWLRRLLKENTTNRGGSTVLLAVVGGILIDNLIVAAGVLLGKGEMLEALSLGRWWLRLLYPPLLIVTYVEMSSRLGLAAAATPVVSWLTRGLGLLLAATQAWANAPLLQKGTLALVNEGGVLQYVPDGSLILPGVLAATIIGAFFGLLMTITGRWPLVLLAAGVLLAEILFYPQPAEVAAGLEVVLVGILVLTEARAQRQGLRMKLGDIDRRMERIA